MDKSSSTRKVLLVLGLLLTAYASFVEPAGDLVPMPAPAPVDLTKPLVSVQALAGARNGEAEFEEEENDPFSPRNWTSPPPPPPEPVNTAGPAQPPPVIVPEGPPPLPYQFMGRLNNGADQLVYLGRGDQPLVARMGDVLEQIYKVVDIGPAQIEFEHLPTGQRQTLPLQTK